MKSFSSVLSTQRVNSFVALGIIPSSPQYTRDQNQDLLGIVKHGKTETKTFAWLLSSSTTVTEQQKNNLHAHPRISFFSIIGD